MASGDNLSIVENLCSARHQECTGKVLGQRMETHSSRPRGGEGGEMRVLRFLFAVGAKLIVGIVAYAILFGIGLIVRRIADFPSFLDGSDKFMITPILGFCGVMAVFSTIYIGIPVIRWLYAEWKHSA
jgi:hypothetical protein